MKASLVAIAVLAVLGASGSQAATVEERLIALSNAVVNLKQEVAHLRSGLSFIARDASNNVTFTVMGNRNDLVNLNASTAIGASSTVQVGANSDTAIVGSQRTQIGQSRSVNVGGNDQLQVIGSVTHQVGVNLGIAVGKAIVIDAGDQITLKTGESSIVMKKDGTITINGKFVDIKSTGDVLIKGSKILAN